MRVFILMGIDNEAVFVSNKRKTLTFNQRYLMISPMHQSQNVVPYVKSYLQPKVMFSVSWVAMMVDIISTVITSRKLKASFR